MKTFRRYMPEQTFLLPPDMRAWLPEGHLALFVSDVVDTLDLSEIFAPYEQGDGRGQPPFHPVMMVKLLVYAYATGKPSSRKIEKATWDDVAYRVLSAGEHPDHDSVANFRKRHLPALARLFFQVLALCKEAGLVKLGHVAIDGTKVQANASKHKAMSYERMKEAEKKLEKEILELLAEAQRIDEEEDARFGKGRRGDELPKELARRDSRLKAIGEAKARLEAQARVRAEHEAEQARAKLAERAKQEEETGKKRGGHPTPIPSVDDAKPEPKAQSNFTDPDSRIMLDGATKGFTQAYNVQAAVDGAAQIIVATHVCQAPNDKEQLVPMAEQVRANLGRLPNVITADAGYFSAAAVAHPSLAGTDVLVPPDRQKHGCEASAPVVGERTRLTEADRMRARLSSTATKALYKMRKAIVEPVFGQIKEARSFRRFALRGLANVRGEWSLIALTHNVLKLFRHGQMARLAAAR